MPSRIGSIRKRILPTFQRQSSEPIPTTLQALALVNSEKSLEFCFKPSSASTASPEDVTLQNDAIPAPQPVVVVDSPPIQAESIDNRASRVSQIDSKVEQRPLATSEPQKVVEESSSAPVADMAPQADVYKRVWVKRLGASATLIHIGEDDLVDDLREKILKKYANSLGRTFDSPDVTIRIIPRAGSHGLSERSLGPEEAVASVLGQYFSAGQSIEEALVIDIPHRRTPRQSPRVYMDHHRPVEEGGDYFSVMPVALTRPAHATANSAMPAIPQQPIHSLSVLTTGHVPNVPLPSPGSSTRRYASHRPKFGRATTASPTSLASNGTVINSHIDRTAVTPGTAPLLTPPISTVVPPKVATPPPRADSPRSAKTVRPKKPKKQTSGPTQGLSLLDGGVPPISVLIVEDNIINLRLLEAFMKKLKVRWQTAMNGRDAVTKWRTGGFHLVLMDIQLPIMSGLEATREIRRLERVNSIGVLSAKAKDTDIAQSEETPESDKLQNIDQFKSPVIVVALTASSLQSDRHEALAAGCNDFLTKPVNFVWLERKVMEWGCMQALIDFDGWREWKNFTQPARTAAKPTKPAAANANPSTAGLSAPPKINRSNIDSNSSSSEATDTAPDSKPTIPNTLVALNEKTESGDTINSMDSLNSDDSVDTIDFRSTGRLPVIPTLKTFSSDASTSSVATVVPPREVLSRQSSSQSVRTVSGRDNFPSSSVRSPAHNTAVASPMHNNQEDARRRKRSSLGRPGLSGVTEEIEGIGAV